MARAWHLTGRPDGLPDSDHLQLLPVALPEPGPGQVLVRNRWLSIDPYMRGRMRAGDSYVAAFELGAPLTGSAIGEVIESRSPLLRPGQLVKHQYGWRDEVVADDASFEPLADGSLPETDYLSVLGATGMTAYFGLLDVAQAKAGETLFVSAAAGGVGSTVVQIAKARSVRVIASAGGERKCEWLRQLGADAVIDHGSPGSMIDKLRRAAPDGIDLYFDNVGGEHLDAALAVARDHARFALCGMIAGYNDGSPLQLTQAMRAITARVTMQGFIVLDYLPRKFEFVREMGDMLRTGAVVGHYSTSPGLESMLDAFRGLFSGDNLGKALVRL